MSDQTGLYQDGNSVFENVFIQGTLNVATANEKLVVDSDGISIDTITTNSNGKTTFSGDVQINGDELFIADSIKHVGDTDTLISFPSNDTITFRTNDTERFRIESTGIKEIVNGNLELNQEFIGFSGNFVSNLLGQTAPQQQHAAIYRPQDNTLCFSTDNAERLRIDSDGNVEIAAGHVSLHLGHGIDFSDTANGTGTTSSELFDDYEEGSFSPSYNTTNSNIGSVTYDARSGRYIKVGRLCFITIRLRTDNISSIGSGTIRITGLPFTHLNSANNRAVSNNVFTANWTSTDAPTQVLIQHNQTYMNLYQKNFNEDTVGLPVSAWNTGTNDNDIRLTAMYETT